MIKLYYIALMLLGVGAFFTLFPIAMWFGFRVGYFMDEYMRMSMLSFFFIGSSLTLLIMMLYLTKNQIVFKKEINDKKIKLPPLYNKINKIEVISGQLFWDTGYFMYSGHADGRSHRECFVPPQTKMMLFKENEKAPKLGSCQHDVVWRYVASGK